MTDAQVNADAGAETPAGRLAALIALTRSLAGIVEIENLALFDDRAEDLAPLQPEKARLAAAYAQSVRLVAADRAGAARVEAGLLAELRAATEAFTARVARQRTLLDGQALGAGA
ncbi:MAG: hypothetical protein R3C58_15085 [Parvularculaceae bacterium]